MISKSDHPKEVFHYTDILGCQGILESGTLFASSISFLNDRKELRFADKYITRLLKPYLEKVALDMRKVGILSDDFDLGYTASREAERFMRIIHDTARSVSPIFILSFCRADAKDAEDGLLSQWRGYGASGGIALCFDREGLEAIVSAERKRFSYIKTTFCDVVYGENDDEFVNLKQHFERISLVAPTLMESLAHRAGHPRYEYKGEKIDTRETYLPYVATAPRLKHPGFSEEREYRIIMCVDRSESRRKSKKKEKPISFRGRDNYLLPYIALSAGGKQRSKLPLVRIIVGPSHEPERRLKSIELLVRECGYDVPVNLSSIPFA